MLKKNKAFTLIELLVVIAIIGILAAVVLSNLNSARKKGTYAKYKQLSAQMRTAMALYYNNNGTYYSAGKGNNCAEGAFLDPDVLPVLTAWRETAAPGQIDCRISPESWALVGNIGAPSPGIPNTYWCADSEGYSGSNINNMATPTYWFTTPNSVASCTHS